MHHPGEGIPKTTDETPDCASSPEITSTSLDAPADGMSRKTTHKRYLGRRRSSQSDELTMKGGQARTPSDRVVDGYLKWAPNRSKIDFICYSERNCGCLKTGGLGTAHRSVLNRSWSRWNDRIGPLCAPKCPSFEIWLGGSNTRLAPYVTMFSFSTAVFCSISLASSSVVPILLLYLSLGVKIGPFHLRVTFSSVLDNLPLRASITRTRVRQEHERALLRCVP